MNKGFLQSSPVQQQMMAGNPNWWNINSMRPPLQQPSSPFFTTPTNSNLYPHYIPTSWHDHNQELPESWSQLLLGGLVGEEEKTGLSQFQQDKKLENWESQLLHHEPAALPNASLVVVDVKQEKSSANNYFYVHDDQNHHHHHHEDFQAAAAAKPTWSPVINQLPAASSSSPPPKSCVTSFSSNMLDFSNTKLDGRHPPPDRSSECNSTSTGGAVKKARVQPSSTQSPFKVRKEKLGDRITSLHQIVSPFGKTDTASVLLEAIGYIRFLQSQIEALSLPYLGSGSGNIRHQQSVQGERNCIFPEDPGQLLNDNCMKRKGASEQESYEEPKKDLRSRGLCLVPLSSTLQVGSDNGADYWAPALGGGGFR